MPSLPRPRLSSFTLALPLSLLALPLFAGDATGDANPFAGLSDELLVPENPYLFLNSVTVSNGFRSDHLEPGAAADDLDLYQLGLDADLHFGKVNAYGSAAFGWDSDQDADTRDLLGGFGYDFDLTVTGIQFTPTAGYASYQQDRDARYEVDWEGPFLGAKIELPLAEKWLLQASYFYHWADFEAELPSAPPAQRLNRADGSGHTGRLDLIYQVNERVDLKLGTGLQSYSSERGSTSRTGAEWESWDVRFGVSIKF